MLSRGQRLVSLARQQNENAPKVNVEPVEHIEQPFVNLEDNQQNENGPKVNVEPVEQIEQPIVNLEVNEEIISSGCEDDSVADENYEPSLSDYHDSETDSSNGIGDSTLDSNNSRLNIIETNDTKVFITSLINNIMENAVKKAEAKEHATLLTKKGSIRKRKAFEESVGERKLKKVKKLVEDHKVKGGCKDKCKKQCSSKICKEKQIDINKQFWLLSRQEQNNFILHHTKTTLVKRRTVSENSRRNHTSHYFLKCESGDIHDVCKPFFLATLGYDKKNDKVVRNVLSSSNISSQVSGKPDGRGKKPAHNKFDINIINQHIESFNPVISHYRREHAPHRRYLPTDISITSMHNNFLTLYPQYNISYEVYRKAVEAKNISFVKLGHEECWTCEKVSVHEKTTSHRRNSLDANCSSCEAWEVHHKKYTLAREEYARDAEKKEMVYSADLQKVIMLPRCDMFKEIIFVPRIIAFNESFVPVKNNIALKSYAFVWHEGVSGRKKEDIISTFYNFCLQVRDTDKLVIWLDNCSAQNKNWALLSFFIYIVNSDEVNLKTIEIKYFEPGHTFMSADSFHHQVEMQLKKKTKVYDFNDFIECVENANKKGCVKEMKIEDFRNWADFSSQYKLNKVEPRPYLQKMVHLMFEREKRTVKYRNSFDEPFTELNFLIAKYNKGQSMMVIPKSKQKMRGVTKERKFNLLAKLVSILPKNRLKFWETLPVNDVIDKIDNEDEDDN